MKSPTFSIITVTYNVENVLQRTIDSIKNQSAFEHIEHIVVDGKSKDSTKDIILKNDVSISQWISETDKGLYDAMNKGIAMATGDYVWFINAGDELYENTTVESLLNEAKSLPDILYGETMEYTATGEELGMRRLSTPKSLDWKSFKMGMLVCHQSILIKRSLVSRCR